MVAFPAGGSTDIAARIVASIAEKELGQPIVVVNKGGAGGQVGWTEMVRQKPDGYYIGFINLPATNTVILDPERKAIFTEKDFTPIINQVLDPGVIWVRADSPYKTLQDLFDAAKKAPGTIRAATTGILSDDHLAILMTEEAVPGATFRIVHLEGGAAQFKEIMAGNIDVAFDNVGSIVPRVKSGEVRALAVMDDVRSKFLPDVPTTKELGFPTVISNSTRGIAATEGHAGADRDEAARGPQEGHGRIPSTSRSSRTRASPSRSWSARSTPSTSPTRTPRPRNTPSGPRTGRRSSGTRTKKPPDFAAGEGVAGAARLRGARLVGVGGGKAGQQLLAQGADRRAGFARILGDVGALHRAQLGGMLQRAAARYGLGEQRLSAFLPSQRW